MSRRLLVWGVAAVGATLAAAWSALAGPSIEDPAPIEARRGAATATAVPFSADGLHATPGEDPVQAGASSVAPDHGLPFRVEGRLRRDGVRVAQLSASGRRFEARDGEVVGGTHLMHSDGERITFTELRTGRVFVVPYSEDCQEMREASPAAAAPTVPPAGGAAAPALTEAERIALED